MLTRLSSRYYSVSSTSGLPYQPARKSPSSSKPSLAGTELLPGSDSLRAHRIGPATGPARRNQRNAPGKPYDGKNKSSSSSGGKKLADRIIGKQPPISLNPRSNGPATKGKNGKLPMRPADWKAISQKFFSEDTKKWLEKRYLGDNLIDLSVSTLARPQLIVVITDRRIPARSRAPAVTA